MTDHKGRPIARRELIRGTLSLGLVVLGAPALAACSKDGGKKALKCDDTAGMPKADVDQRNTLGYVDKAPSPDKECNNCQQFVEPAKEGTCGKCKLLNNGPVNPAGYCKSWAAKPAPPT